MSTLAVTAGTPTAAEIGASIARDGGNAVDAAVAATFATWVGEPGITAMGSGGFIAVWAPGAGPDADGRALAPIVIDGFVDVPAGVTAATVRRAGREVVLDYGGGAPTVVDAGSVGVPGALAALDEAWRRFGSLPWARLVAPAIALARDGFPLPIASARYFKSSGGPIFSESDDARRLHQREDGRPWAAGERVPAPNLADTLETIARDGAASFYGGALGQEAGAFIAGHGGLVGPDDFAAYRPVVRDALLVETGGWRLATNPGPAVGGLALAELVLLLDDTPIEAWDAAAVAAFARAMELAFDDRSELLHAGGVEGDGRRFLDAALAARRRLLRAPSTSNTSVVDARGLACAVSTSTGYGSGVVVPGTGVMFNNMLGEIELLPDAAHAQAAAKRVERDTRPGHRRMPSNMAPSVAHGPGGAVMAIGAGGSDRIVSALAQTWLHITRRGLSLDAALHAPRCHLERRNGAPTLAHEPGIDASAVAVATRAFEEPHMFFGGVQAARRGADGVLEAAGDPRRTGGAVIA